MKTTNYNVRLNPDVKAKAEETFALFGMNLSEAINIFLHKAILENGLPFAVTAPKYGRAVYDRIARLEAGQEKLYGPYNSVAEMNATLDALDSLDDEDDA